MRPPQFILQIDVSVLQQSVDGRPQILRPLVDVPYPDDGLVLYSWIIMPVFIILFITSKISEVIVETVHIVPDTWRFALLFCVCLFGLFLMLGGVVYGMAKAIRKSLSSGRPSWTGQIAFGLLLPRMGLWAGRLA